MSEHAKYSPSGAHRWLRCPGSLAAEAPYPNIDTVYSAEGTAAHALGTRALNYKHDTEFFRDEQIQIGERVFVVDDEMIVNVQMYVDEVRARAKPGTELLIEQKLDLSEVYGVAEQFGTGDAVIVDVPNRHLTVIDLKYGMGVKVYAESNEQMMLYALSAYATYLLAGDYDFITMVIVQPRLDHIDEWTCDVATLLQFMEEVRGKIKANGQERVPGEKQCRFCKHKANCKELAAMVSKDVFDDFESIEDPALAARADPRVPTENEQLGIRLANVPIIENWCKAVRAESERRVLAGEKIIGPDSLPYKIVEGKAGKRQWIKGELAVIEGKLAATLGDKAYAPRTIVTAPQAEKLFGAKGKATWATFGEYYQKAPGKASIAKGSDPRPPYQGAASADEFDDQSDSEE